MRKILFNPSELVTVDTKGVNFKRGKELNNIYPLYEQSVLIEDEYIKDIISNAEAEKLKSKVDKVIDLKDKTVLPGLVECHTHSAFIGNRSGEFRERLKGSSYEDIAAAGGGINTTVSAVRSSSLEEIYKNCVKVIDQFISQGVTTIEIKSGYGLDFANEIKLLKVIDSLKKDALVTIVPTFLGAHTFPNEFKGRHDDYMDIILNKMLPYIAHNGLANFCDAFCEQTAFSAGEVDQVFIKAKELGLNLRLHTEQFNNIGGLESALNHNAVSVDHLEILKEDQQEKLKNKDLVCVLLPGVSFFLNYQYAPARQLIDSDLIVALSTDYNPGTSPILNLHFIMSLAALKMNMSIEETISAVTINAAKALKLNDKIGSIEIGKAADFAIFDTEHYSDIVYNISHNLNCMTIKSGQVIYNRV